MYIIDKQPSQNKRIGSLLVLLFSAAAAAILLTMWGLYKYVPSNSYQVEDILIAPATGKAYSIEQIEFLHSNNGIWQRDEISEKKYRSFFELIKNKKSVPEIKFTSGKPAVLTVSIKPREAAKIFQAIQFSPDGDHFRIQLNIDSPQANWAYFYYPGIYYEILNIFAYDKKN